MTIDALAPLYPWTKALHLISVFAWMAGLFYLPRLFVNHSPLRHGSEASDLLAGMEERLLRIIMNPAMIAAWLLGIALGFLGWGELMVGLFASFLLGGLGGGLLSVLRIVDRKSYPFGPFMLLGAVVGVVLGPAAAALYAV